MSLRSKLITAFGGLLVMLLAVGVMGVRTVTQSSSAIERIFRENYDSVAACLRMKEAIGRLDRIAESSLWENLPNAIQDRLIALQRKGYINITPGVARGIKVTRYA